MYNKLPDWNATSLHCTLPMLARFSLDNIDIASGLKEYIDSMPDGNNMELQNLEKKFKKQTLPDVKCLKMLLTEAGSKAIKDQGRY